MLDTNSALRLYNSILVEEIVRYGIREGDIRLGVQEMASLYAPVLKSLQLDNIKRPNFNKRSHRCAYLHKFAALHTILVQNVVESIVQQHFELFKNLVTSGNFKLCCLGGGPGSDAIGVLTALNATLNMCISVNATIVDIMQEWERTFTAIVDHIRYGDYGIPPQLFHPNYFEWNYIGADLLGTMSNPVNGAISDANLVTMVKFISAAANKNTRNMVTKIFNVMKQGALILFIDNAGGKFFELIRDVAKEDGFTTIFGPVCHYKYSNEELKVFNFGYSSCYETTVTIYLLRKPFKKPNHQTQMSKTRKDVSRIQNQNIQRHTTRNQNIQKQVSKTQNQNIQKQLPENLFTIIQNPKLKNQNHPKQPKAISSYHDNAVSNVHKPSSSANFSSLSKSVNLNAHVHSTRVSSVKPYVLPSNPYGQINKLQTQFSATPAQMQTDNSYNKNSYSPTSSSPVRNISANLFNPNTQSNEDDNHQNDDDNIHQNDDDNDPFDNCCSCVIS